MCTGTHDFIPALDTARLELIYEYTGSRMENVLHVRKDGGWTLTDLEELAAAAVTAWGDTLAQVMSDDLVLDKVVAVNIADPSGPGTELASLAIPGEAAGFGAPGNVTLATKFGTGLIGRSNRGRAFLAGVPVNALNGNSVGSTYQGNVNGAWINFFTAIEAAIVGTLEHVIVSYCGGGIWRSTAQVTPVTTYSTDANIDSQRRRLAGRGA